MGALFEKPAFLILILIVLLLFGAKRLPDLARGARSLRAHLQVRDRGPEHRRRRRPQPPTPAVTVRPRGSRSRRPRQVAAPDAPRYLVDPVTGEQVLAQPVTPPADGAPRA